MPPPDHRVHLRDGDREIEVSGNPAFVRQVLDDLPALMGRLRGEAAGRNGISMPAPPAAVSATPVAEAGSTSPPVAGGAAPQQEGEPVRARNGARNRADGGNRGGRETANDLERQVFEVLRTSTRPLAISAIRERIEGQPTGQEVRRLLERAGQRVTRSEERPATYSLR